MSTQTLDKLFAAMQGAKGIPALESNVSSVLNSLGDDKKGHQELVARIISDFALTQRVLKLANSSMYAPFAKDASSITAALDILGKDALMHVVLGTAMATAAEVEDDKSLSKTLLASEVARNVCTDRPEDVSIAALMYDLGGLMVTKYLPKEAAVIDTKIAAGVDPARAATDVFGMPLQQVGAEVARRWRLPASIVSIIDGTGDPTLVGVAKFSNTASTLILEGKAEEVNQLASALDLPGINKARMKSFIGRKLEETTPAAKSSGADTSMVELNELLKELSHAEWKSAEELAGAMFAGLSLALGTAHCLLFLLTRSGDFGVRYGYGKGIDELKSRLKLSGEYRPTAFHAAIRNNIDLSIDDVSKLKPSALPEGYANLLPKVNKFIVLPLANSRVTGLLYCDWDSDNIITPAQLAIVKKLRDLFTPFIPK